MIKFIFSRLFRRQRLLFNCSGKGVRHYEFLCFQLFGCYKRGCMINVRRGRDRLYCKKCFIKHYLRRKEHDS